MLRPASFERILFRGLLMGGDLPIGSLPFDLP
jgi:hypothetical protein